MAQPDSEEATNAQWDHGNRQAFLEYYREASVTQRAVQRSEGIKTSVLAVRRSHHGAEDAALDIADIGCGPGAQSAVWLAAGHHVHGLDVSEPFVEIARERLGNQPGAEFRVGSATDLPWADGSMDVCLLPELLEHVPDWQGCLAEAARVLRPGGVIFVSTTNTLCPKQNEYTLPLFSWYPGPVKRRLAELAQTRWPSIAAYATYPAVNWFTYPGLLRAIAGYGFTVHDRFQVAALRGLSGNKGRVVRTLASSALLRRVAYMASVPSMVVGVKTP